ncbi:MAG: hypothetical protein JWO59_3032 [Chloroflexi bacterium]|nr:hypothetical protein [Chloroflexota bacterium]
MDSTTDHISAEQMVDLVERRLPSVAEAQARQHLADCSACTAEMARLEHTIALLRTEALEDAPRDVQARAARLLSARNAPAAQGLRRRVLAALRFDSAQRSLAAGARSGQPAARQLLFLAAGHELDLRIAQAGAQWSVTGQLLGPNESGEVTLHGPTVSRQTALNDLGEFALPPVPSGSYALSVRVADLDIEVPDVTVGYTV